MNVDRAVSRKRHLSACVDAQLIAADEPHINASGPRVQVGGCNDVRRRERPSRAGSHVQSGRVDAYRSARLRSRAVETRVDGHRAIRLHIGHKVFSERRRDVARRSRQIERR